MPYGESASAEVVIVTCVYYVGVMTAYTPAIYHGQGSGRGGSCGLVLKVHVRKVSYWTPPRKNITLLSHATILRDSEIRYERSGPPGSFRGGAQALV